MKNKMSGTTSPEVAALMERGREFQNSRPASVNTWSPLVFSLDLR